MIRPDDHLAALFAQDLPAARDPAFSVAVLEAAARRRFQQCRTERQDLVAHATAR